ncbi:MAG: mechanosensitive ion channel domain-containing protein [Burkholderiaceae bacterium]
MLVMLIAGGAARAQPASGAAAGSSAAAPAAERAPIAIANILARADDDHHLVEQALRLAAAPDPSRNLGQQLDDIAASADEKLGAFSAAELRRLPVIRLESLERHWQFDIRRLERWQTDLRQRLTPYASTTAALAQRRGQWEATRAAAASNDLPAALAGRVQTLITELENAEKTLSAPLTRLIRLGQRADAVQAKLDAGRGETVAAMADIDRRLLQADAPPLWTARDAGADRADAMTSIRKGIDIETRFAADYHAADRGNQMALRLLQLLLLPLLIWLSLRSRRSQSQPQSPPLPSSQPAADATALRVLQRPVSAWLLLSMMAVLILEPDAPLLAHEFAMLIALAPLLRLLPPGGLRRLGVWPYMASGLYLLERLTLLTMSSGAPYRLLQLGLTVLALLLMLGLLIWWRRAGKAAATPLMRWLRRLAWFGAALLAAAAVANVLGNVSLAEMLTTGVIDSGYFGLLLYAGVSVSLAVLQALTGLPAADRFRLLRERTAELRTLAFRALTLAAVPGWIAYTLDGFRLLRPASAMAASVLAHDFKFGELSISLGDVLIFGISVLLAFWTARVVRLVLRDSLLDRPALPRGVGNSIASLTYYAVLLLGFLIALSAAGFQVGQLTLVVSALGVGIGFGLQNLVNNFVSGLVLIFERPIQPGDVVDVGGASGQVHSIGMRATIIRTGDGADVIVPNGTLLTGNLTNWTLHDRRRRIDVRVGIAYGSDPAQVIRLLEAAARRTPGVAPLPAPAAQLDGYGASSLDFVLRAWTQDFERWGSIRSDLLTQVLQTLVEAGIEIPYAQYELRLRSVTDEAAQALQAGPPRPA